MKKKKRKEEGQALVEFAIIVPVLIFLICGLIDFGWIYSNVYKVEDAAFTGARYGSIQAVNYTSATDSTLESNIRSEVSAALPHNGKHPTITINIDRTTKRITVRAKQPIKCLTFVAGTIFGEEYDAESTSVSSIPN